jgi:predicted amidophosphoribosyltransferase
MAHCVRCEKRVSAKAKFCSSCGYHFLDGDLELSKKIKPDSLIVYKFSHPAYMQHAKDAIA